MADTENLKIFILISAAFMIFKEFPMFFLTHGSLRIVSTIVLQEDRPHAWTMRTDRAGS